MKITRENIVYLLPLLVGILLLFGPIIFSGRALFWGLPILQFVPWWSQVKISVLEGWLPLWNPNSGMGTPLLANYQIAFFYPPNLIFFFASLLADVQGIAWVQTIVVSFHIFWSGLGMYFLLRQIGLQVFGRIIGSISFAFSGALIARGWFLSINAAISWLPWLLFVTLLIVGEIKKYLNEDLSLKNLVLSRSFLFLVLILSLQLLSGHAQMTWYSVIFAYTWMLSWIYSDKLVSSRSNDNLYRNQRRISKFGIFWITTGVFVIALLFAGLITSIQLIPTAEFLINTPRASNVEYDMAMTYSFWPWRLLGIIVPNIFGNPAYGNYWGYASYWEDAVYIGLLPLLLAMRAIFRVRRLDRYSFLIKYLICAVTISFILALGKFTPIFPFLYKYIPTFDMFNGPARWSILAVASLSILAGIGSEGWSRPSKRELYWSRLSTFGFVVISLSAGIGWLLLRDRLNVLQLNTMVVALLFLGVWGFSSGILILNAPQKGSPFSSTKRWQVAVIILILADLLVAHYGLNPSQKISLYSPSLVNDGQYPSGRIFIQKDDEIEIKFGKYFLSSTFHAVDDWTQVRQTYLANLNILNEGRPSVNNFDPFVIEEFSIWIEKLESFSDEVREAFLNLSWVSEVVNSSESTSNGVYISVREPGDYYRWYKCAKYYQDNNELLADMIDNYLLLTNTIFIFGSGQNQNSDCEESPNTQVILLKNDSHVKQFSVETQKSGFLYISESWYPGWTARVNDKIVDIERANYNFFAIELPPGKHNVTLYYFPRSFILGFSISIITIIVSLSFYLISNRKNRRRYNDYNSGIWR